MSVLIIAEAGVNHNGSLATARKLVDAAKECGADIVKFQSFRAGLVTTVSAPKAKYQIAQTGDSESHFQMLRGLELDDETHRKLADYCRSQAIGFLSSPFDLPSLKLLTETLNVEMLKISSGEVTNGPLLLHAARSGRPVILSTGMSTLAEVENALAVLAFGYLNPPESPALASFEAAFCSDAGQQALRKHVILLHCTTEYPAPFDQVNLRAMETLHHTFGLPVGLSDHTPGIAVSLAAAAMGATVIEKHFTLDCRQDGPDHKASLEPCHLEEMVRGIREIERALGSSGKTPAICELGNRRVARRSVVAAQRIEPGDLFTSDNLACKRPAGGISPMRYWDILGKRATRAYLPDEQIEL